MFLAKDSTLGYVQEGSILLQQALETAASRSTVEPDEDLIACLGVLGREEPEVQLAGVFLRRNRHQTSVTLA